MMDLLVGAILFGFPIWLAIFVFAMIKIFKIRGPF